MASESTRLEALRCADHDRELVAQVLNNAYADGRLTFDEHADRIARAYDARTFGDLSPLTTDLVHQPRPAGQPTPQPVTAPRTPALPTDFVGGNAILSSLKPGAITRVAEEVTVNVWLADAKIDLVGAYASHGEAVAAWRRKAQETVDNAHMRYFVIHAHKLLDPDKDPQED